MNLSTQQRRPSAMRPLPPPASAPTLTPSTPCDPTTQGPRCSPLFPMSVSPPQLPGTPPPFKLQLKGSSLGRLCRPHWAPRASGPPPPPLTQSPPCCGLPKAFTLHTCLSSPFSRITPPRRTSFADHGNQTKSCPLSSGQCPAGPTSSQPLGIASAPASPRP